MKVIIDDQLVNYSDEGSGKALLLLHGWGADISTFNQLASYLSKGFRVIRFDFPGFGQSPKPDTDWKVADYAKLTAELIKKLKIPKIYAVIGHSFGGRVIIKGISQGYFNPEKVVLIGAAGVKPEKTLKKHFYKFVAKTGKLALSAPGLNKLQPVFRKKLYGSIGSTDYLQADQMRQIFVNTINEDLLPEVPRITQPTQLIWGSEDSETPISDGQKMLGLLKNGQLSVISGAGHFVFIDAFDEVKKDLDKFLK